MTVFLNADVEVRMQENPVLVLARAKSKTNLIWCLQQLRGLRHGMSHENQKGFTDPEPIKEKLVCLDDKMSEFTRDIT